MSTALVTHHRFSDPLAAAAAVVVIVGGASVIGVAMSQNAADTTTKAPSAPAQVGPQHPSRIGLGDFQQSGTEGPAAPLKGGHTVIGLP